MSKSKSQLLYLADDHIIVANALCSLVQTIDPSIIVEIFPDGKALFDACQKKIPDLVMLDIEMPIWDGRKTLAELKSQFPDLTCLILSMNSEKSIIQDCINLGAKAYLLKDASMGEFREAFDQVKQGKIYFSIEIMKVLSEPTKTEVKPQNNLLLEQLSQRELEILKLICEGLSPKEIGEKIFLSHRTVETHKKNIMDKFEVNSVSKLIVLAIKQQII
jgi:DNA-binding NarL/FixJ family response regulator